MQIYSSKYLINNQPTNDPTRPTNRPTGLGKQPFWSFGGKYGGISIKTGLRAHFLRRPTKTGAFPTSSYKHPTFLQSLKY